MTSLNKSAIITVAILGYPPIVGCSDVKTIGLPSPGTCIEPLMMPSESIFDEMVGLRVLNKTYPYPINIFDILNFFEKNFFIIDILKNSFADLLKL